MLSILHTADLHLGKRFGAFPEPFRGRLQEARHQALENLARIARADSVDAVLIAGDLFDTETPSPEVLRQALRVLADSAPLPWIVIPGNHDPASAAALWEHVQAHKPSNLTLALTPEPIPLGPRATLLPAPCRVRRSGRDLTEWMDAAPTPDGVLRLGLAHGAIQSFSEEEGTEGVLDPARAARAGLDYLALGDWHGRMRVTDRAWYSGAPERDGFKHPGLAEALVVRLPAPGAPPEVRPVPTGRFDWRALSLDLLPDEDAVERLDDTLSRAALQTARDALVQVTASGRLRPQARAALLARAGAIAPEYGHFDLDDAALDVAFEVGDLDDIDRAGALRQAAEALLAEAGDPAREEAARAAARTALNLLHVFAARPADAA